MPVSLIATKLYIPRTRENSIVRTQLIGTLLSGLKQPGCLLLLSGPAGFGKTTLLSEFAARLKGQIAWLSLDEGDNDPIRFWTHLIAACQTVQASAGEAARGLLLSPQPPPVEAVPGILINDFAGMENDLVLVLDDYQVIKHAAVNEGIGFLIDHLPEKLHIVVSTRVDPPWPLARYRARNQLVEIRANDLRFSLSETVQFLNQTMALNISTQDAALLEAQTEGWAAGLQLAALSLRGRSDTAAFIKAFSGSNLYVAEYLLEEVLKRQPAHVQEFLMKTSILERLNAGICEAVSGSESGSAMLAEMFHANLFIQNLDDEGEWFCYHSLFKDLLRARLQRSQPKVEVEALHQRAAEWYEKAGMIAEAVGHALAAQDYPFAVSLVEKVVLQMVMKAYFITVEEWLQAIPGEFLRENPRVNIALAWMHLMRRNIAKASPFLERLDTFFSTTQNGEIDSSLQGEWMALQSMLLNARGKIVESQKLAEQALKILPKEETKVRGMTYMGLADAYQRTFQYERAEDACRQIIQESRLTGDFSAEMLGVSYLGLILVLQGQLHAAYEVVSVALQKLEQIGSFSPFSATLYGELAEIYFSWNQMDKARSCYIRSVDLSIRGGFNDAEIYYHVFLSRLNQLQGDLLTSEQEINKALDQMGSAAYSFEKEELIYQQVNILLALGHLTAAQEALKPFGFIFDGEFTIPPLAPGENLSHANGLLFNAALRILLTKAAVRLEPEVLKKAINLADLVIDGSLLSRQLPITVKTLLLKSQMYALLGESEQRLITANRALELSKPQDFISIFVEEGQPIADILRKLTKSEGLERDRQEYVGEILSAFSSSSPPEMTAETQQTVGVKQSQRSRTSGLPLVEPLTPRELEVLQLIAAGDSNRAIAEKLVITVSAVKKHTANIYGKLGVNSRTQAVARARQLGLLLSAS